MCLTVFTKKTQQTKKPKPFLYNSLQKLYKSNIMAFELNKKTQEQNQKTLRQHFSLS